MFFRRYLLSSCLGIGAAATIVLAAGPASATQPLETFLEAARQGSYDVRAQRATVEQRDWEKESAFGGLLPAASARGMYTLNQYAVQIPKTFLPPGHAPVGRAAARSRGSQGDSIDRGERQP